MLIVRDMSLEFLVPMELLRDKLNLSNVKMLVNCSHHHLSEEERESDEVR